MHMGTVGMVYTTIIHATKQAMRTNCAAAMHDEK